MTARSLCAPFLALALALPEPSAAEDRGRDAARARSLALGLTALAAVALAVRASDRDDDREDEDDERGDEDARRLPAGCLRPFRGAEADGIVVLHDAACLEDAGLVEDLPLGCAVTLRTFGGFETGFDPRCLGREGWATG